MSAVGLIALAAGLVFVLHSSGPSAKHFDGRGTIALTTGWQPYLDGECVPDVDGPYAVDLQPHASISVSVSHGSAYDTATGQIGVGRVSGSDCDFTFDVDGIPDVHDDGDTYLVRVPGYGTAIPVTKSELKAGTATLTAN